MRTYRAILEVSFSDADEAPADDLQAHARIMMQNILASGGVIRINPLVALANMCAVKDLQPGDLVDLYGDPYADNRDDDDIDYDEDAPNMFEDELAEVVDIVPETPECILIGFEGTGAFGFPVDHKVKVLGHRDQDTGEVTRWD